MPEIKDTGKVWIKGKTSPIFAIRVDDKIFVPGKDGEVAKIWWLEDERLCVELPAGEVRRFSLGLPATASATLFSGFKNTKHGDVKVVLCHEGA